MPSNWLVFDRIRALTRQQNIYQAERVFQDQSQLDRLTGGADFLDNNNQAAILDQTNLQINRLERYKDYEQMDQMGEISLALDLYCLSGDTRIPLLDGSCPTIRELAESGRQEFWVYGYDQTTGLPKPVLARHPHVSGKNAQLFRIRWDGGYIDCTIDHKLHTKRGWVRAGDLLLGDSLTPINIVRHCTPPEGADHRVAQGVRRGYEAIQCGSIWKLTHRWVYDYFNQSLPSGYVVHHKDIRRKNNSPNNLMSMAWLNHRKLHEQMGNLPPEIEKQRRESVSRSLKIKWRDPDYRKKMIPNCRDRGKQLITSGKAYRKGSKPTTDWDGIQRLAAELGQSITHAGLAKAGKISRATLDRMLLRAGYTWLVFKSEITGNGIQHSSGSVRERIIRYASDMVKMGLNPKCWDENRVKVAKIVRTVPTTEKVVEHFGSLDNLANVVGYNHTVLSIVELPGLADDVYDLYVDDGHAFAAGTSSSWVLTHNSDEASLVDPERKHTLVIRARNRRLKKELESLFFDTLLWDNFCRPSVRYLCKYGDLPFEIIPTVDRTGVSSLRFMNVYNFTRIETRFGDLVGFFFQDAIYPQPQFMHPWQVMHLRLTSFENIYHPYGRAIIDGGRKAFKQLRLMEDAALIYRICLTGDSKIWTNGGYKSISNIGIGDKVYCYGEDGKLRLTNVSNQVCNGVHDVYKVSTKYRELRGTATHPFLIKNIYTSAIEYIDLKDLDPERHLIISPTIVGDGTEKPLVLWSDRSYAKFTPELEAEFRTNSYNSITDIMRSVDHPVYLTRQFLYLNKGMPDDKAIVLCEKLGLDSSKLDTYIPNIRGGSKLPSKVDQHFARFVGFFLGDGYITKTNWRVGLALGSDHRMNQNYIDLFKTYHNRVKLEYKNEGKIKRLNTAVVCDKQLYLTFVELGLNGGAHGKRIPGWVYDLPTSHKIEFIMGFIDADGSEHGGDEYDYYTAEICNKELLEDLKVLCDQVGWRTGKIGTRIRNGGGMDHMKGEYTSYSLFINPNFKIGFEKITDISYAGRESVYDISVEDGVHNFVANGCTVHNTRAPEKRKFIIPVGLIPPKEVPEYMQMIARNFKRQRFYNPTTGSFDERYSPLIQEDDFFLPRRPDGTGPDIETLPGAENLDQIADIEYFKKKMVAPTKIPFARVGIGDGAGEASEKSLSQSHAEFAKAVQWVQREVATGLTKVALVHLALRGYSVEDLKGFSIALTATSAMEELYRIETWQTRVGVMADLKDLGWFPKEWIVTHFTDLTPDEIEELKDMEQIESDGGSGGGGGGVPGGLDLGGPEMDLDLGGEEGAEPEEPAEGVDEDMEGLELEGFDRQAEHRLLLELRNSNNRGAVRRLVNDWSRRIGKPLLAEKFEHISGYSHFLDNKELDGLTRATPDDDSMDVISDLRIFNPNMDTKNLLVEWSTDEELRLEVIKENYELLMTGDESRGDDSDEITDADVPAN